MSATLLVTSRLTPGAVQIDRRATAAEACAAARAEHARTGAAVRVVADGAELLAIPEDSDEEDVWTTDDAVAAWLDAHARPEPAPPARVRKQRPRTLLQRRCMAFGAAS